MISTTVEQSKHLIELGLRKTSSDLYYCKGHRDELEVIVKHENLDDEDIIAWSLSALLEVMPKPDLYRETADLWVCATFFKEGSIRGFGETAIDAACDTITKMFVRGYLKKKGGEQ